MRKVCDGNCSKDMVSLVRNIWEVMWDGKMTTEFWVRDLSQSLWPSLACVAFCASCLLHLYEENSTASDLYLLQKYNLRNSPKSQWFTTISIPFSLINLQVTGASFLSDAGYVQGYSVPLIQGCYLEGHPLLGAFFLIVEDRSSSMGQQKNMASIAWQLVHHHFCQHLFGQRKLQCKPSIGWAGVRERITIRNKQKTFW